MSDRFAVSSIAWQPGEAAEVLRTMQAEHVTGLEIAPTTIWANPTRIGMATAAAARRRWADQGFQVVAFQALLYGRPDLRIFGDATSRRRLERHLGRMARLAGWVGAPVMVFGSPRNRATDGRARAEVDEIATGFFRSVARAASDHGTSLCVEPNPPQYGTDFVTTIRAALELVATVDEPGFGIHIDTGAALLEGPSCSDDLIAAAALARHVHLSEPALVEFGTSGKDHEWIAAALRQANYAGWRSIEMTTDPSQPSAPRVRRALVAARRMYG